MTDGHGCIETAIANVTEPLPLVLDFVNTNVVCQDDTDGIASTLVTGGTTPYSYNWSTGHSNQSVGGLGIGIYDITVTDNNGCTTNGSTEIISTTTLSYSLSSNDANCF